MRNESARTTDGISDRSIALGQLTPSELAMREQGAHEARCSVAVGSVSWRDACKAARKERLNRGLRTLASWAQSRAMLEHDEATTLTMLERKTAELRAAVDKAGWDAVAAAKTPNAKSRQPGER